MLLAHTVLRAWARARAKTGKRIAARIAMMAITTRSSIRVKPDRFRDDMFLSSIAEPVPDAGHGTGHGARYRFQPGPRADLPPFHSTSLADRAFPLACAA